MTMIEEGRLKFQFDDNKYQAIKFDDTSFYRESFMKLPGGKGVDIVADSKEVIQLIEIKNCVDHEVENLWRTSTNNSKLSSAPRNADVEGRDSFDIETVKKVTSTLLCLYGAWTKSEKTEKANEISTFWQSLAASEIKKEQKKILIVLFLEGDFDTYGPKSRTKKMIMLRLRESIQKKLSWLNCQVTVVDSTTYKKTYFDVI